MGALKKYYSYIHYYKLGGGGGGFCALFEEEAGTANPLPVLPGRNRDAPHRATSSGGTARSCTRDDTTTESTYIYIHAYIHIQHT